MLRRQVKWQWSKPLVVLTPKSLLRHRSVVSSIEELASGRFQKILPDERTENGNTDRVILCSGKVYYDLVDRRKELNANNVAIIRIEQFYPLSSAELMRALNGYAADTEVIWFARRARQYGRMAIHESSLQRCPRTKVPFAIAQSR